MERREILKSLCGIGIGALVPNLPANALAKMPEQTKLVNYKALFNEALKKEPGLIGFANVEQNFEAHDLIIEGKIPADISGAFYRNGPGKHERGEQRYQHLFEGDGMLQSFLISNGKIRHQGKFINTPKFKKEQQAGRFLYSGPDTRIENSLPVSSSATINTANTNVISVGDDLWALWEGGAPTKVDSKSLTYREQITLGSQSKYGKSLQGLPFSAHPKIEANGDIWNFGLNATGHIVLYHLSSRGAVKNVGIVNANYQGAMLHDFLITNKHILLILPSLIKQPATIEPLTKAQMNRGYFSRIGFDAQQPMRVLLVDKASLSVKKEYQLEAGFAFHYGNAWEEKDGTVHFDASLYPNVDVLHHLSRVMQGKLNPANIDAKTALYVLKPDGSSTQTVLSGNSEFPRICEHLVGVRNDYLYHLSSQDNSMWSDSVCSLNVNTGKVERFNFGHDFLVEEHISICPQKKEGTGYLLGTALHIPSKRTCLNIFDVTNLADGPIARAWLPYHLPLGFHGNFKFS